MLSRLITLFQILILRHGRLASNVSMSYPDHSIVLSNLEPDHVYHVQIAGINTQGLVGPFSTILQVRPQPSLALDDPDGGDFFAEKSANVSPSESASSSAASSIVYVIPAIVCVAVLAGACAAFVVYSRRNKIQATTNAGGRGYHKHSFPSFSSGLFSSASMRGQKRRKSSAAAAAAAAMAGRRSTREFHQTMPMSSSETM